MKKWLVAYVRLHHEKKTAERLTGNGMVLRPGSPDDLATFQAAEIEKWKRLVTAAGIELQ